MDSFVVVEAIEGLDDMAKSSPLDEATVDRHVGALKSAGTTQAVFDEALVALKADKKVGLREITSIAWTYGRGGTRPKSRAAAVDKIERRFIELARSAENLKIAKAAKPW